MTSRNNLKPPGRSGSPWVESGPPCRVPFAPVADAQGELAGDGTPVPSPASLTPAATAPEGWAVAAGQTSAARSGASPGRPPATRRRKPPLTGLALLASKMPENGGSGSLDYALRKMLDDEFPQLLRQHNSDSRRAHEGFPDWVIAGLNGRMLVRELKRETTQPTRAQEAWLAAFSLAGIDTGIWRPSDLLSGRIARELAALAGLAVRL